jgi:hypothetical protein
VGLAGQELIVAAVVAVVGGDLTCQIAAHALAAAGVGRLRWVSRGAAPPPAATVDAWRDSNPELALEGAALPQTEGGPEPEGGPGRAWLACLAGASAVLRSGFDDDAMLAATVRLGIATVVVRGREAEGVELLSFRVHRPCPHVPLDAPAQAAAASPDAGAQAVLAGQLAAAEVLVALAGIAPPGAHAAEPGGGASGSARMLRLPAAEGPTRSADIPWSPGCFACGGSGQEMTFS